MNKFKLGRRQARPLNHKQRKYAGILMSHLDPLGTPPVKSDWTPKVTVAWGMDGNDEVGCCTCADCSHQVMLWTANAGSIVIPTTEQTLELYSAITGYDPNAPLDENGNNPTDTGANIDDVCAYFKSTGYMGMKLDSYAPISRSNVDHIKWGIQLFGSVKTGIRVPANAQEQFNAGQPWHLGMLPFQPIEGGHDVPLVGYDADYVYCVTWGKVQAITYPWLAKYLDEVICPLSPLWIESTGAAPSGLDMAALQKDMGEL